MRYLIIEDEEPAAQRLEKMVKEINPAFQLINQIVSVKSAVKWLTENSHPDLIFMDIQLADGNSFEIFNHVKPTCPIIFTTAYDQYAVQAFRVNSIDYLLKPVKREELKQSMERYNDIRSSRQEIPIDYSKLATAIKQQSENQRRIIIRFGDTIKAVELSDVAYFYTENKINYLMTFDKKNYAIDLNLDEVEGIMDHSLFFRINRQFIINFKAINRMISYSKSRVKLELAPPCPIETIVSTDRSPHFKDWLTGFKG